MKHVEEDRSDDSEEDMWDDSEEDIWDDADDDGCKTKFIKTLLRYDYVYKNEFKLNLPEKEKCSFLKDCREFIPSISENDAVIKIMGLRELYVKERTSLEQNTRNENESKFPWFLLAGKLFRRDSERATAKTSISMPPKQRMKSSSYSQSSVDSGEQLSKNHARSISSKGVPVDKQITSKVKANIPRRSQSLPNTHEGPPTPNTEAIQVCSSSKLNSFFNCIPDIVGNSPASSTSSQSANIDSAFPTSTTTNFCDLPSSQACLPPAIGVTISSATRRASTSPATRECLSPATGAAILPAKRASTSSVSRACLSPTSPATRPSTSPAARPSTSPAARASAFQSNRVSASPSDIVSASDIVSPFDKASASPSVGASEPLLLPPLQPLPLLPLQPLPLLPLEPLDLPPLEPLPLSMIVSAFLYHRSSASPSERASASPSERAYASEKAHASSSQRAHASSSEKTYAMLSEGASACSGSQSKRAPFTINRRCSFPPSQVIKRGKTCQYIRHPISPNDVSSVSHATRLATPSVAEDSSSATGFSISPTAKFHTLDTTELSSAPVGNSASPTSSFNSVTSSAPLSKLLITPTNLNFNLPLKKSTPPPPANDCSTRALQVSSIPESAASSTSGISTLSDHTPIVTFEYILSSIKLSIPPGSSISLSTPEKILTPPASRVPVSPSSFDSNSHAARASTALNSPIRPSVLSRPTDASSLANTTHAFPTGSKTSVSPDKNVPTSLASRVSFSTSPTALNSLVRNSQPSIMTDAEPYASPIAGTSTSQKTSDSPGFKRMLSFPDESNSPIKQHKTT